MKHFKQYLQSRNLAQSSITHYVDYVEKFFTYTGKEAQRITKKDILNYLNYLKEHKGYENITRKNRVVALDHFFNFLLDQREIESNPASLIKIRGAYKKQLYRIYSPEELTGLFDQYYELFVRSFDDTHIPKNQQKQSILSRERSAVILSILIHQGTTTKDIDRLQLCDLDPIKATLKVRGSNKSNERVLPLKAEQIGLLMHYLQNIRPQFLEYGNKDSQSLFLPLPVFSRSSTTSLTIMHTFKSLTPQIKTIDKGFLNFKQIRASVITYWIQTEGLRKAQYKAGHKYIHSTENYLPNDISSLKEDISKYNPFT